mgnify:CR=1 FL=1
MAPRIEQLTPGPSALDMLRDVSIVAKDTPVFLRKVHSRFGDIAQFPVPIPAFSINDVDAVDRVLRTNAKNYTKQTLQYGSLKLVTGEGLLTADGEIWRAHRRALQPAFHRTMQQLVVTAIEESYDHFAAEWRAHTDLEISAAMQHVTLEVVGRSLFGTSLSGSSEVIAEATLKALKVVVAKARMPLPIPLSIPTPNNVRLNSAVKALDAAVAELLAAPSAHPDAFITLLREAHESDPERFDVTAVRDEIVTFIVAGHETVASALTWTLQLLNENPETLARVVAEARSSLNTSDLNDIPLAVAAFAESLRLYPPAWLITRESIDGDELCGVSIPPKSLIIMSPYLLQRTSRWDQPDEFIIDRFLSADSSQLARADYLPFGLGARMCIGRDMALAEGPMLLAKILRDFDIVPTSDWSNVGVTPSVTLHPTRPMNAKFTPVSN